MSLWRRRVASSRTVSVALLAALVGAMLLYDPAHVSWAIGARTANVAAVAQELPQITAFATALNEVRIAWQGVADVNVEDYRVRRDGRLIGIVNRDARAFVDASVQPSTAYTYTVEARDVEGAQLALSSPVAVKTPAPPETPDLAPPTPPEALTGAITATNRVFLDWYSANDNTDITAYVVRRDGRIIAVVDPGTLSYVDADVQPSTSYIYTIEAIDVVGYHSVPSNQAVLTTLPAAYP